jgi:hypothetical protein
MRFPRLTVRRKIPYKESQYFEGNALGFSYAIVNDLKDCSKDNTMDICLYNGFDVLKIERVCT